MTKQGIKSKIHDIFVWIYCKLWCV